MARETRFSMKHLRGLILLVGALLIGRGAALAQGQETEIPGVTARLAYLRQSNGLLRAGILLKNTGAEEGAPKGVPYSEVYLLDAKTKTKQFPLKAANGHFLAGPISDWDHGGRWFPHLAKNEETLLWFMFDPVPADHKVSLHVPSLLPFDDVSVTEGPAPADPGSSTPPLRVAVVSATRSEGELKVRLKLTNPGKTAQARSESVQYENVWVLDPKSKKLYGVLQDTQGAYIAEPISDRDHGGRYFLKVPPGGQAFMSLTFQAPPDDIRTVDILVPWFAPLEGVTISGQGGAAASGVAVAGQSLDLQGALKDLNAQVTPQQIKVSLAADLLFDFDKADIKPGAEPSLDKVVTVLKASPGSSVSVEGHADGKGADAYNQALSEKRAAAVAQWLASRANLPAVSVHTKGWGKSKPIAPNTKPDGTDNPEGRAKNRRVEIIVTRS